MGILYNSFVMNFRPHLALVAADRIPIEFVALYFVNLAGHTVSNPGLSFANDFQSLENFVKGL